MRVLFGTHQLERRAGSELFTAELAIAIRDRGHDVAIFTFFKGDVAHEVAADGIPVFDSNDTDAILRFEPDIVQTSHIPCAHFLRALAPRAARLHAMLGVIPHLEAPPLGGEAVSLGLAVSEEVRDRIDQTAFARETEIALFRNWFDDRAVVKAQMTPAGQLRRIAVVSHHVSPDLASALATLEAAGKIKADYFGSEHRTVVVDGALLSRYEAVISIGRTPLLAAACGIPCILADIHGSDGLLTADNLDNLRTRNFSGRMIAARITAAHIEEQLSRAASYDREALRKRVVAEYALSRRVDWLLDRYDAVVAANRRGAVDPVASSLPSEGLVYAELVDRVQTLTREINDLREHPLTRAALFLRRAVGSVSRPRA